MKSDITQDQTGFPRVRKAAGLRETVQDHCGRQLGFYELDHRLHEPRLRETRLTESIGFYIRHLRQGL